MHPHTHPQPLGDQSSEPQAHIQRGIRSGAATVGGFTINLSSA